MSLKNIEETFYDIMGFRLDNTSQLKLFNLLQDTDGDIIFNIFNSYELSDEVSNNSFFDTYEVDNDDWWDNISFKVYGTPYLWWTIALTNRITNPFEEISPGDLIYVLQPQYIYQMLKEIRNIGVI